jgi:soluble cytochrome b562
MTRAEHLAWCKKRALEYVDMGNLDEAFASMLSDLGKHEETRHHMSTMQLGMSLKMNGHLDTAKQMRDFIEGFN